MVPKANMKPIQSYSFAGHFAVLAVDDSLSTYTISTTSKLVPSMREVAWWQTDLGDYYTVSQVDVTSSPFPYCKSSLLVCIAAFTLF